MGLDRHIRPGLPGAGSLSARLGRAIDYLEAGLGGQADVEGARAASGLSRRSFYRRFEELTGLGVEAYLRRRRLSEAARALAAPGESEEGLLLRLALDSGYASQAAFTRAFHREFGLGPGAYRRAALAGRPPRLHLLAPSEPRLPFPPTPVEARLEDRPAASFLCLGTASRLRAYANFGELPRFWEEWFRRRPWRELEGLRTMEACYGLSRSEDGRIVDYRIGLPAGPEIRGPARWERIDLPPARYAVFPAPGPLPGSIQAAILGAYRCWLPRSGHRRGSGWDLERYPPPPACPELLIPLETAEAGAP